MTDDQDLSAFVASLHQRFGDQDESIDELLHSLATGVIPAEGAFGERWMDTVIAEHIPLQSRVLDLGCGKGQLLQRLISEKSVHGQGVDYDIENVIACTEAGVPCKQADLEQGLAAFPTKSFDYVVLEKNPANSTLSHGHATRNATRW